MAWIAALAVCLALEIPAIAAAESGTIHDARVKEGEILTPLPGESPRINGPQIHGARENKAFVFRIACQGKRPIGFRVDGLPNGLELDAERGVIRGRTPANPGTYAMTFHARNSHGEDSQPFKLVIGDKLALTPPTGYSSWGGHMLDIDQATVLKVRDVFLEKGLADAGFQFISIDDGWARIDPNLYAGKVEGFKESGFDRPDAVKWVQTQFRRMGDFDPASVVGPTRDANGRPLPNDRFPDMKAMVDALHLEGIKAGIYSSPGLTTCQIQMGSWGHEAIDARQFADWGFDMLKYDRCGIKFVVNNAKDAGGEYTLEQLWKPMVGHLRAQDRDIIYNLCQYGVYEPWIWAPEWDMQTWRIGGDLNGHTDTYFKQAMRIAKDLREHSKPGQWNDPDYLYIHKIKSTENKGAPAREIDLTTNQRYQYVTLWSIVCAPFIFACDINEIDEFTTRLVGNAEILNVNQDELGLVAEVRRETEEETVMTKRLADGSQVLALFNRNPEKESVISVAWEELGLKGPQAVRDLWRQKDLGARPDGIAVRLSPSGCAVLSLRDPGITGD